MQPHVITINLSMMQIPNITLNIKFYGANDHITRIFLNYYFTFLIFSSWYCSYYSNRRLLPIISRVLTLVSSILSI